MLPSASFLLVNSPLLQAVDMFHALEPIGLLLKISFQDFNKAQFMCAARFSDDVYKHSTHFTVSMTSHQHLVGIPAHCCQSESLVTYPLRKSNTYDAGPQK